MGIREQDLNFFIMGYDDVRINLSYLRDSSFCNDVISVDARTDPSSGSIRSVVDGQ